VDSCAISRYSCAFFDYFTPFGGFEPHEGAA
jgi:hypothetical protein